MDSKKLIMLAVLFACASVTPVMAQGQNTEGGVHENAREKIDASEGVDMAEEKMMEGREKGEEASGQDITEKGKDVLSSEEE